MRILGIDPGKTGALAIFDRTKSYESGLRWVLADMPGEITELRDFLRRFVPDHCFLERVSAMKGWSVSTCFKLGHSLGMIEAALQCCDVPITLITPPMWKRFHDLLHKEKHASCAKAVELFPEMERHVRRVKDNGRADAILIASYGASRFGTLL